MSGSWERSNYNFFKDWLEFDVPFFSKYKLLYSLLSSYLCSTLLANIITLLLLHSTLYQSLCPVSITGDVGTARGYF
jgi:hypothetical protein